MRSRIQITTWRLRMTHQTATTKPGQTTSLRTLRQLRSALREARKLQAKIADDLWNTTELIRVIQAEIRRRGKVIDG